MPVNEQKVRNFIDDAMGKGMRAAGTCCAQVELAFRHLQSERRKPGKSLDLDLAAAEHYLCARWMVCKGTVSPNQMRAMVVGYDIKKILNKLSDDPNKLATTPNPVSPPDTDVVNWGLKGVVDGSAEHDRCNKSAEPPLWRPIDEIFKPNP
jgi:hypothetical protein